MIKLEETHKFENLICNSGGALGSDSFFESIGEEYGVKTRAFSYKTRYHNSPNKVEISDVDYNEGVEKITLANKILRRPNISRFMNLLARNWAQVKYSGQVFAIGTILNPKEKNKKGYYSKSDIQIVDGGTGWACAMSIISMKDLYVYEQNIKAWFRWSYVTNSFIRLKETPFIKSKRFAGIGTREINEFGISAIRELYQKSFEYYNQ